MLLGWASALALLAACSSGGPPAASGASGGGSSTPGGGTPAGPSDRSPEITIACAASTVKPGAGDVTCTASVQDASGPVAWALSGPGQLSATTGDAVEYSPPASLGAEASATITAAAAGVSATAQIRVLASVFTIAGKVVDEFASPLEGEKVLVPGLPPATTDASGSFTVSGVEPPYQIIVARGESNTAFVYQGLTRSDPILPVHAKASRGAGSAAQSATLEGDLTGGDDGASGSSAYQGVFFASPQVEQGFYSHPPRAALGGPPASFSLEVPWHGPGATTGTAFAIQWRSDASTHAPSSYWYALQQDVTLLPEGSTALALELQAAPAMVTTSFTVRVPTTYHLIRNYAGVALPASGVAFWIFVDDLSSPPIPDGAEHSAEYVLPSIPGATILLCAEAQEGREQYAGTTSIACANATGLPEVTVDVPRSAQPVSPASNANDVTVAMKFQWSPFASGVHAVKFTPRKAGAPQYFVFTAAVNAILPDLSAQRLGLPSGTTYDWEVRGTAPFADLDAFTAPAPSVPPLDFPVASAGSSWGRSTPRSFVTR